ncbi:MAG: sensor histidine kinase [Christensenellales bacterium]
MKKRREISVEKTARLAWVLNFIEIGVLLGIVILAFQPGLETHVQSVKLIALAAGVLLMANNMINLHLNNKWVMADQQYDMLRDALGHVELLNAELRSQKHDFMNHLQVVLSLVEMNHDEEARGYIEKIHGDMQSKSLSVRTLKPAVNALLQAKLADCEKRGIQAELRITSSWRSLPIEEWEMCRVLGNIIDNAMEALKLTAEPKLEIELYEDLSGYGFKISNNGPIIPQNTLDRIWLRGFSTRAPEGGMGLYIVRSIMLRGKGTVEAESTHEKTTFSGYLPLAPELSAENLPDIP